jgi:hypothetical protein
MNARNGLRQRGEKITIVGLLLNFKAFAERDISVLDEASRRRSGR